MKVLRLLLSLIGALVVLVALLCAGVVVSGWLATRPVHASPASALRVTPDSTLLARGEHLAGVECTGCHSSDGRLPLGGGVEDFFSEPGGPPFGHLIAPNLTPGGVLADYSDAELGRAIREGLGRDGRPLLVMPSASYHSLSDRDLAAIIACLRRQPSVRHIVRAREIKPLALAVIGARLFSTSRTEPITSSVPDPQQDTSAAYGGYLVTFLGCSHCHGADLRGARKGQFEPLGPNLIAGAAQADRAAFSRAIREGVSPRDGHTLNWTQMPWLVYKRLGDDEVAAIHNHLVALAAHSRP